MADVNYIKPLFEVYRFSKKWMQKYDEELNYFIDSLCTVKGISYEEFTGGSGKTNDNRMTEVSDLIKEFESEFKVDKAINTQIINFCEIAMNQMDEKTRKLFDYYFTTDATMEWVAEKLHYGSKSSVHENITKQSEKMSDISERVRHSNIVK